MEENLFREKKLDSSRGRGGLMGSNSVIEKLSDKSGPVKGKRERRMKKCPGDILMKGEGYNFLQEC